MDGSLVFPCLWRKAPHDGSPSLMLHFDSLIGQTGQTAMSIALERTIV